MLAMHGYDGILYGVAYRYHANIYSATYGYHGNVYGATYGNKKPYMVILWGFQ